METGGRHGRLVAYGKAANKVIHLGGTKEKPTLTDFGGHHPYTIHHRRGDPPTDVVWSVRVPPQHVAACLWRDPSHNVAGYAVPDLVFLRREHQPLFRRDGGTSTKHHKRQHLLSTSICTCTCPLHMACSGTTTTITTSHRRRRHHHHHHQHHTQRHHFILPSPHPLPSHPILPVRSHPTSFRPILPQPTPSQSIHRHIVPFQTIPYHTIPYHTMPFYSIPYHTMPYHTIPYHTIHRYQVGPIWSLLQSRAVRSALAKSSNASRGGGEAEAMTEGNRPGGATVGRGLGRGLGVHSQHKQTAPHSELAPPQALSPYRVLSVTVGWDSVGP